MGGHIFLSAWEARTNGESGACVFQDGVGGREGMPTDCYQEGRDKELHDKESNDQVEVRHKQVSLGREMVMTGRGMFSTTDGWERKMPKDRSKLADLPDTE